MASSTQLGVWGLLFLCYCSYYVNRANYSFWVKTVVTSGMMDVSTVGVFGTVFEVLCGICKVFGGVVVDAYSPRHMLAGCLLVCAACNALMFVGPVWLSVVLWGVNGLCQGTGWPCMVRILFKAFPRKQERGTWYSALSTSQSAGSAVTPLMLTAVTAHFGWLAAVRFPAALGVAVAAAVFFGLGQLVPDQGAASATAAAAAATTTTSPTDSGNSKTAKTDAPTMMSAVVLNATMWRLGAAYFFISVIRSGMPASALLLLADREDAHTGVPITCLVLFDVGATCGGLAAGYVTDTVFRGRRGPLMVICSVAVTAVLAVGLTARNTLPAAALFGVYFLSGMLAFCPHMLYGLSARELAPDFMSTAGGLVKGVGQLGSAAAGYPLGQVAALSWTYVPYVFATCGAASAVCVAVSPVDPRATKRKGE